MEEIRGTLRANDGSITVDASALDASIIGLCALASRVHHGEATLTWSTQDGALFVGTLRIEGQGRLRPCAAKSKRLVLETL